MPDVKRSGALPTIFSFFLGLIVTAFVGVGVYTFHPSPERDFARQLEEVNRQEQDVRNSRPPEQLTLADRDQIQVLNDERNELNDAMREAREAWGRSTSIVLIVFATIAMAISLVRADRMPVISNGLLLGGIFTMLYGVGWIVATDTSVTRFVIMTVALVITLALGYVRFVRREIPALPAGRSGTDNVDLGELGQRVRDLEERMNRAASVLGDRSDR
jgi:hypothetical protein